MSTSDALGETIRAARRRKGLSQADVAMAAGVGRGVVQKLETGRGSVTVRSLLAILQALSLDMDLRPRGGASQRAD